MRCADSSDAVDAKRKQAEQVVLVGEVLAYAFLKHLAELVPDVRVGIRLHLAEHVEHALRQRVLDRFDAVVLLQDLPRDVERQVVGIHHAADEAQVERQEVLRLVHDEHALHVELQAARRLAVPEIERRALRHVKQTRVLEPAFHLVVAPRRRVLEVVRDVLVERLVLVLADVVARPGPQRLGLVYGFKFVRALLVVAFAAKTRVLGHHHWDADVVRVLANHGPEAKVVRVLLGIVAQGQRDARPAGSVVHGLYRIVLLARATPSASRFAPRARRVTTSTSLATMKEL